MKRYQLCFRDEYRQVSILATSEDLQSLIDEQNRRISSDNFDNALTSIDQNNSWENYAVKIFPKDEKDKQSYVYAGKNNRGKDSVIVNGEEVKLLSEITNQVTLKVYLGVSNKKEVFAELPNLKDRKSKITIDSLDHEKLKDKGFYYIILV
jgi:hypothetical protein